MRKRKGEPVKFRPPLATEGRLKFATTKLDMGPSEYFSGLDANYGRQFLEMIRKQRAAEAKRQVEEVEAILSAPVP